MDCASRAAKNSPLGCFCAVFCNSAAAVRIHPCSPFCKTDKTETPVPIGYRSFLVGAGGFEPPKLKAADLQSVPIGHSGTRPYSFSQSRGLPVYVTTENAVCQPIIWAEGKNIYNNHKSPPIRVRFAASGQEGFFSLTKNQEKITSGSSCRCGAADRRCTAGSARPESADGRSPRSPQSSGCGCCSSSSGEPSFPGWRPR